MAEKNNNNSNSGNNYNTTESSILSNLLHEYFKINEIYPNKNHGVKVTIPFKLKSGDDQNKGTLQDSIKYVEAIYPEPKKIDNNLDKIVEDRKKAALVKGAVSGLANLIRSFSPYAMGYNNTSEQDVEKYMQTKTQNELIKRQNEIAYNNMLENYKKSRLFLASSLLKNSKDDEDDNGKLVFSIGDKENKGTSGGDINPPTSIKKLGISSPDGSKRVIFPQNSIGIINSFFENPDYPEFTKKFREYYNRYNIESLVNSPSYWDMVSRAFVDAYYNTMSPLEKKSIYDAFVQEAKRYEKRYGAGEFPNDIPQYKVRLK